ncbi:aldose epimerase family protein [Bacteroidota bacterium]
MKKLFLSSVLAFIILFSACNNQNKISMIPKENFNKTINGKEVKLFVLKNKNGIVTEVTNYGGKVVSQWIPDRDGNFNDIVLGYDNIDDYLKSGEAYFGALIGRYGNRIAKGKFSLNGKEYTLATNNNENHLHGGEIGYNAVVWDAREFKNEKGEDAIELKYVSADGEEGYPGELDIAVVYTLTNNNEFVIEYSATCKDSTVLNLTHHSFFNLLGAGNGDVLNHELKINASHYTPVDGGLIPTGEIAPVAGTPMDFTKAYKIGERVNDKFEQLFLGKGYDHNWVLDKKVEGLSLAASVYEPVSGRTMDVLTTEPGIQFYGGNFLDGSETGKENKKYNFRTAFCLETQHFPDTPNKPEFPSCVLAPGQTYKHLCIYKFGTK